MDGRTRALLATSALIGAVLVGLAQPVQAQPAQAQPVQVTGGPAPVTDGNPFAGADGYVNADWSANAAAAATAGGELGPAMAEVARQPTAVWLESIASIEGGAGHGRGLRGHLDAALAQQAAGRRPVVTTLVLYNLPERDCMRSVGGELSVANGGLATYKINFIDPIAVILADPRYAGLRIAVVIEPQALWGAVIPSSYAVRCIEYQRAGVYLDAIPYVLTKLHAIPNVYAYLDIAQSNLLGWADNFAPAVQIFERVAKSTPAGTASVDGFAVNVAAYDPIDEPLLDIGMFVGGTSIRQSKFVDWNLHLEERTYLEAMYAALVAKGFSSEAGMLIDTSRNGWGGSARPTVPSTSLDINTFVDQNRVDRRPSRYLWCNQLGAGIGERPRAAPAQHIHAYAWIKPPGESDGHYPGEPLDTREPECNPIEMPPIGATLKPSNARAGAPPRGHWFGAAFTELVRNAYPPLP